MITVRFDTGFSVQYNNLNWIVPGCGGLLLYESSQTKGWSAFAPLNSVVEIVQPCRTYNPSLFNRDARMEALEKELRAIKNRIPARNKKAAK